MEKRGVVAPGWTPPEHDDQKTAAELEEHPLRRAEREALEQRKRDLQAGKDGLKPR